MINERENRDSSRTVGTAVGGVTGGAAAGAIAGTMFGPIGTLIGAGIGMVAGAALGRGVAEQIDPAGETEYWRSEYQNRSYAKHEYDFDRDYSAAYDYGLQAREKYGSSAFSEAEDELRDGWNQARGQSRLSWEDARPAIRDSFNRADRTYKTYEESDRHFQSRFGESTYAGADESFDDYRPAYRYGVLARTRYGDRQWDDDLDSELSRDWERNRGNSKLSWERARAGVREAFSSPYVAGDRYSGQSSYDESGDANEGLFRVR